MNDEHQATRDFAKQIVLLSRECKLHPVDTMHACAMAIGSLIGGASMLSDDNGKSASAMAAAVCGMVDDYVQQATQLREKYHAEKR